jgi:hypothetical protein
VLKKSFVLGTSQKQSGIEGGSILNQNESELDFFNSLLGASPNKPGAHYRRAASIDCTPSPAVQV